MIRIIFSIGLIFCLLLGYSQDLIDTVYFDKNWNQCISEEAVFFRTIKFDTEKDIQLIVNDYYKSGSLQMKGMYKSINPDYKMGKFEYYYENGQKQIQCNYENNLLEGNYLEWHPNGNLKIQKFYTGNLLNGEEKNWDSMGNLTKTIEYKNGYKYGQFNTYYANGKLKRKDVYKNDSLIKGRCFNRSGRDTLYYDYLEPPIFQGGIKAFKEFILKELKYPEEAKNLNIEGEVYIKFTISTDGKVTRTTIIKEDKTYFNQEAIRVVKMSPTWIPGRKDGQPSEFSITIPIKFKLTE